MKSLVIALLLITAAESQTADVIVLSTEDAVKLKQLYGEKDAVDKRIKIMKEYIATKYLPIGVPGQCSWMLTEDSNNHKCVLEAWRSGFDASKDFKFIVPKTIIPITNYPLGIVGINH